MIKSLLGSLLLAATVGGAEPMPSPAPPAVEPPSIQAYGDRDASCQEWIDGCRACAAGPATAAPLCSNIGIACQPKEVRCTARTTAPDK